MKTNLKTFPRPYAMRWKELFEAEIRDIMEKVKPQRDLNEYNVYHFCKLLLGES